MRSTRHFIEVMEQQTGLCRHEALNLEHRLSGISEKMEGFFEAEEQITQNLKNIRSSQKSLHARIESAKQKLARYKKLF